MPDSRIRVAVLLPSVADYRERFFRVANDLLDGQLIVLCDDTRSPAEAPAGFACHNVRTIGLPRLPFARDRKPSSMGAAVACGVSRSLQQLRPDIVVSSELGPRSLQAWAYCRRNRLPFILWACLSEHTERNRGFIRRSARRFLLSRASAVLVNGPSGDRYVRRISPRVKRVVHLPYCTDPTLFARPPSPREYDASKLLTVGQLIERKGLLPFADSLFQWLEANPTRTLHWTLVGSGPLRRRLETYPFHSRLSVRFLPQTRYADLGPIYHAHGLFAFPTLADEWGVVVNEAMAAGLPILGSIASQAVDVLVEHRLNGWRFDPTSSPVQRQAIINEALTSPSCRLAEMGKTAERLISELHPDIIADRFVQLIRDSLRRVQPY